MSSVIKLLVSLIGHELYRVEVVYEQAEHKLIFLFLVHDPVSNFTKFPAGWI